MPAQLPLSCSCGHVRGEAKLVGRELRLACHCADCQAFTHFLDRPDELLDAYGATEVVQLPPARIEITQGAEQLACMRLSPIGLMRWYTSCCDTPVANTMTNPGVPFTGLMLAFAGPNVDASTRDQLLGPIRARVNGPARQRDPDAPPVTVAKFPLGTILRSIQVLAGGWFRNEHTPSPFFDGTTGAPRATPRVLSEDEREKLRERVLTWA
ncbi:DUF6151 family protein [Enhygromyxa salina]|nr:DUF6151 family protein [Enhygromyxa salina]